MPNLADKNSPVKHKSGFILRDTPAWLDQHQEWISDGARKLYKALRTLADHRTGELAIPGRGEEARWIKPTTIDRKAGMCDETRKKYMRELLALGAVRHERKRITRRVGNRLRAFLGVSRYTFLELKRPIAASHAVSSTAKSEQKSKIVCADAVSSMAKSSTAKTETDLLRPTSSTVEEVGHEYLSYSTSSAPPATGGGPGVAAVGTHGAAAGFSPSGLAAPDGSPVIYKGGRGQNSPPTKPPTYLTPPSDFEDFFKTLPTAIQRLTESFKITAWPKVLHQEPLFLLKKEFIDCITAEAVLDYKATCELWEGLVRWIRWWQLTSAQKRQAALAACGIYEPENPNLDPRPIDPAKLMECALEDPECLACGIEAGAAWMEYADGTWNFYEGEYKPDFCEPDPPNCLPQSSENVTVETSASI